MTKSIFLLALISVSSFSALAANKPLFTCHTDEGASVFVTVVEKTAFISEISHRAKGIQATQRVAKIQGLSSSDVRVSDSTGVILSLGNAESPGDLNGIYFNSSAKKMNILCRR